MPCLVIRKSLRICRKKRTGGVCKKREGKAEAAKKRSKTRKKNDGKSEKKVEKQTADMPKAEEISRKRRIPFRIFQRRRTSQRASLGQSDVLYGRDFESESLAIEQIQGRDG